MHVPAAGLGERSYIDPVSVRPWRSANTLEVLIFLLRTFLARLRRQVLLFRLPVMVDMRPSIMGIEALGPSPAESTPVSELPSLGAGLVGRGEKVPWLQEPACEQWRSLSTSCKRAVVSVGASLGPACGRLRSSPTS